MNQNHQASRCRQQMREIQEELGQLASVAQGRLPWLQGSLYPRRRRCGKRGCRCGRGKLHQDMALAMRVEGKSRLLALRGAELERAKELIRTSRQLSQTRAQLVRTFGRLLKTFDTLGRLRQVDWIAARWEGVSPT